jgi:hypothetical protein
MQRWTWSEETEKKNPSCIFPRSVSMAAEEAQGAVKRCNMGNPQAPSCMSPQLVTDGSSIIVYSSTLSSLLSALDAVKFPSNSSM